MIDDEGIVELFFERSEQAIRELDVKYGKLCHRLSYNTIPPAKPNPLQAYICKIVRNTALKSYYKKEAAKRGSSYTIAMEEIEAYISDTNSVEAELEAKELKNSIAVASCRAATDLSLAFIAHFFITCFF